MKKALFFLLIASAVFSGCSLLPYKTEFTCPGAVGGTCGNALQSYNNVLKDIENSNH